MIKMSIDQLRAQFPQLQNIAELKIGGQKAVYDAIHSDHGNVVLKIVLHEGNDPRVLREIEIVQSNSFPNVPSIYEAGNVFFSNNSFIYICEKRISGLDLRSVLDTKKQIPLSEVLIFLDSMLKTVAKLEVQGIVHRDIKPDNVLCDEQGNYWLVDFGIARNTREISLTATSANFGFFAEFNGTAQGKIQHQLIAILSLAQ
jgi:serine/threonine-protein kinase